MGEEGGRRWSRSRESNAKWERQPGKEGLILREPAETIRDPLCVERKVVPIETKARKTYKDEGSTRKKGFNAQWTGKKRLILFQKGAY